VPAPYLGGFAVTDIEWSSIRSIAVRLSTTYGSSYCYQLYAGRSLIGWTERATDRAIIGQLTPTTWPQHLQVLAVDPLSRETDYGSYLPQRPYNRAKLSFSTSSWPTDAKLIEVTAGTEVAGAVDSSNIVASILFTADGEFSILSPVMPGSGVWNFEVQGRDDRLPAGNVGDALELSATLLSHPPDVVQQFDDSRFSVAVASGVATVTYELPA
jgi:hypothetical protein